MAAILASASEFKPGTSSTESTSSLGCSVPERAVPAAHPLWICTEEGTVLLSPRGAILISHWFLMESSLLALLFLLVAPMLTVEQKASVHFGLFSSMPSAPSFLSLAALCLLVSTSSLPSWILLSQKSLPLLCTSHWDELIC